MDFARGPSRQEPLPLGPRPVRPGEVAGLVGAWQAAMRGATAPLDAATATVAPLQGGEFPTGLDQAVAEALNAIGTVEPGTGNAPLGDALAGGAAIDSDTTGQQGELPGPDDADPDVGLGGPIEQEPSAPAAGDGDKGGGSEDDGAGGGGGGGGGGSSNTAAIRDAIRQLYLELLNREPDPGGWDGWVAAVIEGGHSLAWVRERFLESEEYRQLHGG